MSSGRILVADDEPSVRESVGYALAQEGFDVDVAVDGNDATAKLCGEGIYFDLLILDIMMPGPSGLDICRDVRSRSAVPIIVLTAKDAEVDKVVGLEVGADDYVTKPFSPRELVLRVQAIVRRGARAPDRQGVSSYGGGAVVIDEPRRTVTVRGTPVQLTPTEWGILGTLATVPGRVYSRFELINKVRGYEFEGYERTVDSHVKNLRRKVEEDPGRPRVIMTVLGGGYRLGLARDD